MHNHNEKGNKSMVWMMAICCGLPLLVVLLIGGGGRALSIPTWVIFSGMTVMILAHFMMGRHKHGDDFKGKGEPTNEDKNKNNKTHSGHGCCH